MTLASDLRAIVTAARPTVEEWLDIAEQFTSFREACKERGLDWGQIKALVKAQILDERDNGERVAKIIEKADFASSYAAMLGMLPENLNENNIFDDQSLDRGGITPASTSTPAPEAKEAPAPIQGLDGTGEVRPRVSAAAPPGSATKKSPATVSDDDDMAIPAFMRRTA